jgi:two-component system, LytTR family, sensor kinase
MVPGKKHIIELIYGRYRKNPILTSFVLQFILWTILGIIGTAHNYYLYHFVQKKSFTWQTVLLFNVPLWWFWLAGAPFIIKVTEFVRTRVKNFFYGLVIHVIICILTIGAHQFLGAIWCNYSFGKALYMPVLNKFRYRIVNLEWPFIDLLVYGVIIGIYFAWDYYRKFNEEEIKYSQLETKFVQAKLLALKMQIHPHFLFNTLNSISTLIVTGENEKANKMLTLFGDFLRQTLDGEDSSEITLAKEIDFITKYIDVQKIRFGERMHVFFDILPETTNMLVPNFLLQPVVENSVRYAIADRKDEGIIAIRSHIRKDKLILEVEDNGPGLTIGSQTIFGIGLTNTKERLANMYKGETTFNMKNLGNGFLVTMEIPVNLVLENENTDELKGVDNARQN